MFSKRHAKFVVPLIRLLYYVVGWIAGIISDAFIKKKPLLIFSIIYTALGYVHIVMITDFPTDLLSIELSSNNLCLDAQYD